MNFREVILVQSPSDVLPELLTEAFFGFCSLKPIFFLSKDAKNTFTCVGKFNNGDRVRTDIAPAMTSALLEGEF